MVLKVVWAISKKSGKKILQFDILFLASTSGCSVSMKSKVLLGCPSKIKCPTFDSSVKWFLFAKLINRQSCHHIETRQLICSANQLSGFYMMATLAFNELIRS